MQVFGQVVSIQVGLPRTHGRNDTQDVMDSLWTSGFFKKSVKGPVRVGRTNIEGDGQADLVNHGGIDKAILAYSADHYPAWRAEMKRPDLPHGAFGENLTVAGLCEDDVCVGDVWQLGETRLQVSQPRQPCWKLARRWRLANLPKRVVQTGRSGWYYRVLTEGVAEAGRIELIERPFEDWPVSRCNAVYYGAADASELRALAELSLLAEGWKRDVRRKLNASRLRRPAPGAGGSTPPIA